MKPRKTKRKTFNVQEQTIRDLRARLDDQEEALVGRAGIMAWVRKRLLTLRDLSPHEWDRSTLLELAESLSESNPKLRRKEET